MSHKGHEEEGDLQDMMLDVVDAFNHPFVPCRAVEVFEEADKPDAELDEKCLR